MQPGQRPAAHLADVGGPLGEGGVVQRSDGVRVLGDGLPDGHGDRRADGDPAGGGGPQVGVLGEVAVDLHDVGLLGPAADAQRVREDGEVLGDGVEGVLDLGHRVGAGTPGAGGGRRPVRAVQPAQCHAGRRRTAREGLTCHRAATAVARASKISAVEVAPGSWWPMLRGPR